MSKQEMGEVTASDGKKFKVVLSGPDNQLQGKLTEEQFRKLLEEQEADRVGVDGKPFRHFAPEEVDGRPMRQWKSFEFAVTDVQLNDAVYWCGFYHGGESIVATKKLPSGRVAVYSEYQCF